MKCSKCGHEFEGNFCSECGTKASSDITYGNPPLSPKVGKYEGNLCAVTINENEIVIEKKLAFHKSVTTKIPFPDIVNVSIKKNSAFVSGYICIRTRENKNKPLANSVEAASDPYSANFLSKAEKDFCEIYLFLKEIASQNLSVSDISVEEGKSFDSIADGSFEASSDRAVQEDHAPEVMAINPDHAVKVCPNCGDILLGGAKHCPTCGQNTKNISLIDKSDENAIAVAVAQAPHPKSGMQPKWKTNLDQREAVWAKEAQPSKHQVIKERIKNNRSAGIACCPKCGSTSLSSNKKGFGIGKAVIGDKLAGPIGLVAGNIGAKKVIVTCLNCGHRWKI